MLTDISPQERLGMSRIPLAHAASSMAKGVPVWSFVTRLVFPLILCVSIAVFLRLNHRRGGFSITQTQHPKYRLSRHTDRVRGILSATNWTPKRLARRTDGRAISATSCRRFWASQVRSRMTCLAKTDPATFWLKPAPSKTAFDQTEGQDRLQ